MICKKWDLAQEVDKNKQFVINAESDQDVVSSNTRTEGEVVLKESLFW